jgi:predicted transcriptional regulator YdeE
MGQGYSKESSSWIPKLWEEANADFSRITSLVKHNADGSIFGLWGLMSDTEEKFLRWSESGKYLAGCEVDNGVLPPEGFTKWTVPTQKYIVAECSGSNYFDVFNYVLHIYAHEQNMEIFGAIHERYPQPGNPNLIELYFPVEGEL